MDGDGWITVFGPFFFIFFFHFFFSLLFLYSILVSLLSFSILLCVCVAHVLTLLYYVVSRQFIYIYLSIRREGRLFIVAGYTYLLYICT